MRRVVACAVSGLAALLLAGPARAHEFRAAVLVVDIDGAGGLELRLELPAGVERPRLVLPAGCEPLRAGPTLVARCTPAGLEGAVVVEGLSDELELVAQVRAAGQPARTRLVRASEPSLPLTPGEAGLGGYVRLGVAHILGGFDHLLFVVGLALWVRGLGPLVATLTAFTAAHSLTLALAALGLVRLPQAPVEACIALSLVLLARAIAGGDLSRKTPWKFAGACGLLHGLGFAGALAEVGLPADAVVPALAAFNLGVEFGQVVALVAVGLLALALLLVAPRAPLRRITAYLVGGLAVAWLLSRLLALGN